jgi:hypothetical protein
VFFFLLLEIYNQSLLFHCLRALLEMASRGVCFKFQQGNLLKDLFDNVIFQALVTVAQVVVSVMVLMTVVCINLDV